MRSALSRLMYLTGRFMIQTFSILEDSLLISFSLHRLLFLRYNISPPRSDLLQPHLCSLLVRVDQPRDHFGSSAPNEYLNQAQNSHDLIKAPTTSDKLVLVQLWRLELFVLQSNICDSKVLDHDFSDREFDNEERIEEGKFCDRLETRKSLQNCLTGRKWRTAYEGRGQIRRITNKNGRRASQLLTSRDTDVPSSS
jgi:hypothetical protein